MSDEVQQLEAEVFRLRRELCEFEAYETTKFDIPGSGAEHMFLYAVERWGREYAQKLVPLEELTEYADTHGLSTDQSARELWEGVA